MPSDSAASIADAHIAPGPGALRALLLDVGDDAPLRDLVPRLAARLSTRAPHVLWLVVATQPATHEIAIAAWTADRRPPRVAALVANRLAPRRQRRRDASRARRRGGRSRCADARSLGRDPRTRRAHGPLLSRARARARRARGFVRPCDRRTCGASSRCSKRRGCCSSRSSRQRAGSTATAAFIAHQFDRCMARGGRFHDRVLRPLFFGTLNTPVRRRAPAAAAFGARAVSQRRPLRAHTGRATHTAASPSPTTRTDARSRRCSASTASPRAKRRRRGTRPPSIPRCSAERSSR